MWEKKWKLKNGDCVISRHASERAACAAASKQLHQSYAGSKLIIAGPGRDNYYTELIAQRSAVRGVKPGDRYGFVQDFNAIGRKKNETKRRFEMKYRAQVIKTQKCTDGGYYPLHGLQEAHKFYTVDAADGKIATEKIEKLMERDKIETWHIDGGVSPILPGKIGIRMG